MFNTKCTSIKQLWSNLNSLYSFSKKKGNMHVSELLVKDNVLTNPIGICNAFNEYFCNIGKSLASDITRDINDHVRYCDSIEYQYIS